MVRLSLPGFNPNEYSATRPPPLPTAERHEKFNLLRRIIILFFLILLLAFLLGFAWFLVEAGYLGA